MEIQDRNSLLQILGAAKDGKTHSSSVNGNLFADILKSAKDDASFPQNDSKDVDFKQVVQQKEVSDNVKDRTFDKKETSPEKTEVASKETNTSKKEESKPKNKSKTEEEDSVSQTSQSVEDKTKVSEKDEPVSEASDANKTETEDTKTGDEAEVVAEENTVELQEVIVASVAQMPVFEEILSQDAVVVNQNVAVVEQNAQIVADTSIEEVSQSSIKETTSALTQVVAEEFVTLSEEEAVLMEQAKYFDEKVASDKKLKIEVNVSEAKIADPIVKDVLKNRFEIDSMFQSVDETVNLSNAEAEIIMDENSVIDKNTNILPEAKNVVYAEVKTIHDAVKTTTAQDVTVASVSGKEFVAEVANVSRNEAFAKINEASIRDDFKGMTKEVVEQIKVNITKSAVKGVDTIDIQLKPEDLGKVQVKMHIAKDGKVQVEIMASRAETAELLQKDASSLSKAFNEAGYDTDAKSFTFSFQNENQAKGQEKDDSGLLKFIGDTLEQEAENIAGNDNLGYDPVLGLNIRV